MSKLNKRTLMMPHVDNIRTSLVFVNIPVICQQMNSPQQDWTILLSAGGTATSTRMRLTC